MQIPLKELPRSIWALFAVRLVIAIGNFVFPFLTLILTVRLGWPADKTGLFLTAMQAAALPGVLVGGKLSDAIGRKKIIVTCQAVAVILFIASLLVGFKPILPFLIAGASVSLAMTWPISGALVADLVPPDKRKSAYALLYWGNNIGFSIGPLAAGFLFHRAPGLMFLGNAVALSVSIFVMTKFVPETRGPNASIAVSRGAGDGSDEDQSSEKPSAEADYRGSLFAVLRQRPTIWMFSILVAIMNFVYSQYTFSLPLYLNEKLGERGSEIFGSAMTVNGLTVVVFTLLLSRATSRTPVLLLMAAASALYALGFGMLSLPPSFLFVMASTIIWTWGEILSATNINVYIASKTPASHRGRVNSFVSIVTNLGSLSGPLLAGLIISAGGTRSVWPFLFFIGMAAAVLMIGLGAYDRSLGPGSRHRVRI
ncbi:MAG: MFS transporter [Spirochaetales bacterium]